jgi:F-type H+-transporting ATPase subunit delta
MKNVRLINRDARQLFRFCVVNGRLDEGRVRQTVKLTIRAQRRGALAMLSRFQRLARLDQMSHHAKVASAASLPPDVRRSIEAGLQRTYGEGLAIEYASDPTLIAGVRITVGSDVYDGSVKGGLAELAARFSEPGVTAV